MPPILDGLLERGLGESEGFRGQRDEHPTLQVCGALEDGPWSQTSQIHNPAEPAQAV